MSAEPTAAEREDAHVLAPDSIQAGENWTELIDRIAAAIAAAREEGRREADDLRQRVEALAARWYREGTAPIQAIELRRTIAAVAPAQPAEGAR